MYSSSSISKRIVLVPFLAAVTIQILLLRTVSSLNMTNAYLHHKCFVNQGKYKPGSVYEKDLISIIDSIPLTSNFSSGYEMMSLGKGSNYVSAILQCRGDSYGTKCRSCYATAVSGVRKRCPRYKGGIIWYDQCLLDISTIDTIGKIDYENNFCISNAKNVSGDQYLFNKNWLTLINNLTTIAIRKDNHKTPFYAAGKRRFGTTKLYGMVQCTQDISSKGCQECVVDNIVRLYECLSDKRGARVIGRSCIFRFELYPFVTTHGRS